jgi:hypothetical protein
LSYAQEALFAPAASWPARQARALRTRGTVAFAGALEWANRIDTWSRELPRPTGHAAEVYCAALSADGSRVVTASKDRTLKVCPRACSFAVCWN